MNRKILAAAAVIALCISAASAQAQSLTADTVCLHDPFGMACTTQRVRLRHELDATCRQDPRGQTCTDLRTKLEAATANATGQTTAANICQRDPYGDACAEQRARNGDPSALEAAQARHAANREALQRSQAEERARLSDPNRPIAPLVAPRFEEKFGWMVGMILTGDNTMRCAQQLPSCKNPAELHAALTTYGEAFAKAATTLTQPEKNCLFKVHGQYADPLGECRISAEHLEAAGDYFDALTLVLSRR